MRAPTNGGTSPSSVAIPTSHGSSIRRRASLYTQNATESQNTARKRSTRLRIRAHVLWLKKSKSPLSAAVTMPPSEEKLPDQKTCAERQADDRHDDDHGERDHAQLLAELAH